MRAEYCGCQFYESWVTKVNLKRAELCKCEFHEG